MKIAHKDDYNAVQKRCEGASSSVAGSSIRIMMSHFVALLVQTEIIDDKTIKFLILTLIYSL